MTFYNRLDFLWAQHSAPFSFHNNPELNLNGNYLLNRYCKAKTCMVWPWKALTIIRAHTLSAALAVWSTAALKVTPHSCGFQMNQEQILASDRHKNEIFEINTAF